MLTATKIFERHISNCYDCDDDMKYFSCDYEIEYDYSNDDGDILNLNAIPRDKT